MLMPSIFGENLLDDFFDRFANMGGNSVGQRTTGWNVMRTDVKENDAGYELHIDLPGFQKENVKAELKDGYLTICARSGQDTEQKDEEGTYIRRERYCGTCSRSFYVGREVTQEDIRAKFEDGILKISVPKKVPVPAAEEQRYIPIEG